MGESKTTDLKVEFDRRIRLQFHGAKVTSDAGLLAVSELDEAIEAERGGVPVGSSRAGR